MNCESGVGGHGAASAGYANRAADKVIEMHPHLELSCTIGYAEVGRKEKARKSAKKRVVVGAARCDLAK